MKKHMRYISLSVVLILLISIPSCKGISVSNTPKTIRGVINIWCSEEYETSMKFVAQSFKKVYPKATINIKSVDVKDLNIEDKLENEAHIFMIQDEDTPYYLKEYKDKLANVTNIVNNRKSLFKKEILNNISFNEKVYAVPVESNPYVMVYRKDIFSKYKIKIEDINTWNDYIIQCEKLKKDSKISYNFLTGNSIDYYEMFLNQLNKVLIDSKDNVYISSSESMKSINLIRELRKKGILRDDKDRFSLNSIKSGKVVSFTANYRELKILEEKAPELKGKFQIAAMPSFEAGGNKFVSINGGNLIALDNNKYNNLINAFFEFLLDNEKLQLDLFNQYSIFPSNLNIQRSKALLNPVEYFGADKIWQFLSNVQKQSFYNSYSVNYPYIKNEFEKHIYDIMKEKKSLKESTSDVEKKLKEIIKNTGL